MYRLITLVLCFFMINAFAATPKKVLKIETWKTKKGTSVYFVKTPNLPMLDMGVIFTAGSAYDGKRLGLASYVCHLIGGGTLDQNVNQIARTFDGVGAKISTNSDRDKTIIALRTLTAVRYSRVAINEFIKIIAQPSFPQSSLQVSRNQAIAAIKVSQQEPGEIAENAFFKAAYGNQPYAHNPIGDIASLKKISRAEVVAFYKRYYVAKNMDIILVGNLSEQEAKQLANALSKALPAGKHADLLKLALPLKHAVYRHIEAPTKQTAIVIGQVGINPQNPDYFPLLVGNYAFGGMPLGSILFQEVRNQRGLAYDASSTFQVLRYRGPFIIELKTRADKTKEALSVVTKSLDQFIAEGPTDNVLNAAKQNLIGRLPLAISNNGRITNILSRIAFYHLPLNYLDTYESRVRAVTPKIVKNAFEKTVNPKHLVVITVGPVSLKK